MAASTELETRRHELNRKLAKPEDWQLFWDKIGEYSRNGDTSRHEIKLSGKRVMAICMTHKGWQAAVWSSA